MKRKSPMPSYYGKNIAQHAQRCFFKRKQAEARRISEAERAGGMKPQADEGKGQ